MNRQGLTMDHLEAFKPREHEKLQGINLATLVEMTQHGEAVADALIKNGKVVAIIGFIPLWEGVANVFVVPGEDVRKYRLGFVVHVMRELDRIIKQYGFRRVQTNSLADAQTDRWMQFLGFEPEGVLKEYSVDKKDYRMWARFS